MVHDIRSTKEDWHHFCLVILLYTLRPVNLETEITLLWRWPRASCSCRNVLHCGGPMLLERNSHHRVGWGSLLCSPTHQCPGCKRARKHVYTNYQFLGQSIHTRESFWPIISSINRVEKVKISVPRWEWPSDGLWKNRISVLRSTNVLLGSIKIWILVAQTGTQSDQTWTDQFTIFVVAVVSPSRPYIWRRVCLQTLACHVQHVGRRYSDDSN